jgi:hypothetical protein
VLLTRSRLCPRASPGSSLHLHVLSTPPAFVLSQDQTLREELLGVLLTESVAMPTARSPRTRRGFPGIGQGQFWRDRSPTRAGAVGGRFSKPGRTRRPDHSGLSVHMLLSFQRPPCLFGGDSSAGTRESTRLSCAADEYSARAPTGEAPSPAPRHDKTWTTTSRRRGRSSKSSSTNCCQVPSTSSPSTIGTVSEGPISAARRCAWAFVSALRRLCS